MSGVVDGWVEGLAQDLGEAEPAPAFSTFGLVTLLAALLGALVAAQRIPAAVDAAADAAIEDPGAKRSRAIQAALNQKAAGRYRESWRQLRLLHDAEVGDPAVNLELAQYHQEVGNLDFAREYLSLVEERTPDAHRVRILRARLALARAAELQQLAGRVGVSRARALQHLVAASGALELARSRLPEASSPGAPGPVRKRLEKTLVGVENKIMIKRIRRLTEGSDKERHQARELLSQLKKRRLGENERISVTRLEKLLAKAPVVWRSGS